MYRLHVVPASGAPFEQPVDRDTLVVGRATTADLVIEDQFLSRHHSRFFQRDERLYVEDLGSRNGTLVNGREVTGATEVRPGDVIQISGSQLTVAAPRPPRPLRTPRTEAGWADGADGADGDGDGDGEQDGDGTVLMGRDAAAIFRPAADLLDSARARGGGAEEAGEAAGAAGGEELRRYAAQLRILNDVHHALSRTLTQGGLLELILDRIFDYLRPEQGVIYLRGPDGALRPEASRSVDAAQRELLASRSLAREVAGKGLAALVLDAQTDARFAGAQSIALSGVRSVVAAPLLESGGTLGMIVLGSQITVRQFTEADMELLVSLASVAALYLRNLALALEAAERRRLADELALARQIQLALLPQELPALPGYELYGGNEPSRGVSGDFYAVTPRAAAGAGSGGGGGGRGAHAVDAKGGGVAGGAGECVVVVADISGKGMAASLLTASLEAFAAGPIEDGLAAEEICARLSRLLYRRTPPNKFATAFIGVLDLASGAFRYANAGHNPPLLVRAGGEVELLAATGPPIALLPGAGYEAATAHLAPGDTLLLYTDGIVEAADPEEQEYGDERLIAVARAHRADPCGALAAALAADLESFVRGVPFADDRTLVLVRRLSGAEPARPARPAAGDAQRAPE